MKVDYLIVGSGVFGAVMAERIANVLGKSVLVIERRSHIGGNCYSEIDPETGIEVHRYGTHIFHTSNEEVWRYLSQFTELNSYRHQVLTVHKDRVYQMPINLETINTFYGKNLRPSEARAFLKEEIQKEFYERPANLEEKAISLIGRPLYEAFIRGYTIKQWDRDPKELPAGIITRLPVRFTYNEDYFNNCAWQGIPADGYTAVFMKLLDHKNIRVETDTDYFDVRGKIEVKYQTIYTGPIDRLFDFCKGKLDWRTVKLEKSYVDEPDYQGTSVMNYADADIPYTRIHEPRHLHPEREYSSQRSVIFREYSFVNPDDPYYPIKDEGNAKKLSEYREFAAKLPNFIVGGRLGDFAYYDMDMSIGAALKRFETKVQPGA